ncbi:hypothetical protein HG536_0H03690 [Torulaspora globosa]|uniref:Ubiquitin-like protein ATG12 n=1 Tax=Torulaspora globosa TaxID=48254 RepID=A0A7G3ZNA7_9SACH|nr:uncharacterized protein HG536_0H03690 [Torulaspora globosa]QLL34993.1 hypothetical protein HG536_0H03690 [Torulaspora globosa]
MSILQHIYTQRKLAAVRSHMSRILESESDNDESGQSSLSSSANVGAHPQQEASQDSHSNNTSNMMQRKLEHFSRRLSMLGLVAAEGENKEGTEKQANLIDSEGSELLQREVPMTTSLLLNKLPKATSEALEKYQAEESDTGGPRQTKVQIKFQPIGSIPQVKPSVCRISAAQPFALVTKFLSKSLKVDQVYCYINNSFAPNPQQIVGDLWSQFKVDNELIVSYCGTVAFG